MSAREIIARALSAAFEMDPDELERASDSTDELVPRYQSDLPRADAILSALEAAGFEVTKAGTIPRDLAELVVHIGKAEWGSTPEHDADGHADHVRESVRITAEHFGQTEPQKMHGLYVEGTETVVCHTGTGPNSPQIARALTGAWNYLHERCVAMLSASNPKEIAQQAKDAP